MQHRDAEKLLILFFFPCRQSPISDSSCQVLTVTLLFLTNDYFVANRTSVFFVLFGGVAVGGGVFSLVITLCLCKSLC